jgi:hypothetical protein
MKNGHGSKMVENREKETGRWTRPEQQGEKKATQLMRSAEKFLARIHGKKPDRETIRNAEKVNGYLVCLWRKLKHTGESPSSA